MPDNTIQPIESQGNASLEPLGVSITSRKKKTNNPNSRAALVKKAMVAFIDSEPRWYTEKEIDDGCQHVLPSDAKVRAHLVHRTITQNNNTFRYRKPPGDRKVTLAKFLERGGPVGPFDNID